MGWLASAFVSLFGSVIGWFGKVVVKKLLILAAVTALLVALIATLHAVIQGALNQVASHAAVPTIIVEGMHWLPSNVSTVLSIVIAVEVALWVFRLSRRVAEYRLSA